MTRLILTTLAALLASNMAYAKPPEKGQKHLPPGLQKKMARGGELPPGWQKKLRVGEPLEQEVYDRGRVVVPVDNRGLITLEVGGKLLRLYRATREIVEILR